MSERSEEGGSGGFSQAGRRQAEASDVCGSESAGAGPSGPPTRSAEAMLHLLDETHARELEARLVRRAKDGDRASFEELVRAHFAQVYRVLFRLVGSHEDAEDLAQECFVRAWRGLAWYREE